MIGEMGLGAHEQEAFVRNGHLVTDGAVSGEILADLLELLEDCQLHDDPFFADRSE